jgi:glycosyltransferase involved in cell wall biosynthesis
VTSTRPLRVVSRVNNVFTHDARVKREAEALVDAGYDVTVVADLRGDLPSEEMVGTLKVKRIAKSSAIPYWSIIKPLLAEKADFYHANDIDSLFPCLAAARLGRNGAKVVYDSHELWSGHAADKVHRKRKMLVRVEGPMLRAADALVTASPAYTEVMVERYHYTGPVETINNTPRAFTDAELAPYWAERDADPLMRIMSVGVFQHGRGAVKLVEALAYLPEDHVVEFVGTFPQPDYEALVRAAAAPFGDRVIFAGRVPSAEVVPRLATAKLSAVLFEGLSCESYRLVSPNKLFESMAAGTPIIASDLPVVGGTATREGMGVICNPDDPRDIARAIQEAIPRIEEMRPRARSAASRNNWDLESKKLVALYAGLKSSGR